jgi:hypothetical protein
LNPGSIVGTRTGPYEIVGWLGAGGMGDSNSDIVLVDLPKPGGGPPGPAPR